MLQADATICLFFTQNWKSLVSPSQFSRVKRSQIYTVPLWSFSFHRHVQRRIQNKRGIDLSILTDPDIRTRIFSSIPTTFPILISGCFCCDFHLATGISFGVVKYVNIQKCVVFVTFLFRQKIPTKIAIDLF